MPSGTGAVNLRNVPGQKYRVDPAYFDHYTERNVYSPFAGDTIPTSPTQTGTSGKLHRQLDKVGVVARLTQLIQANLVTTTGASGNVTSTYRYPWSLFRHQVSGNGSTDFINVDGLFLFVRQVLTNPGFRPNTAKYAFTTTSSGTYAIEIYQEIPVAMDMVTLTGALYAQAKGTSLSIDLTPGTTSDSLVANTTASIVVNNNSGVTLGVEFYSVPFDSSKDEIVVPDVELLHGFTDDQQATGGANTINVDLQPFVGQLERLYFWTDNAGALVPSADYSTIQFQYGGTQQPLTWTGAQLRYDMNLYLRSDPNVPVIPDGVFVIDFVHFTPTRNVILMDGVTSPRLHLAYTGVSWGSGPYVKYAVENLFV